MRRAACFLCICFCSLPIAAKSAYFTMQYKGPAVVEAGPRSNITVPFFVSNSSRIDQEIVSSTELPEFWQSATSGSSITVPARGTELVLVHVFVPMSAGAGEYRISLTLTDSAGQSDSIPFTVLVLPEKGVQVSLVSRPDYILQGESYDATYSVINSGNIEIRYGLSVFSGNRLPYSLINGETGEPASEVTIPAGTSLPVLVRVDTASLVGSGFLHTLELKAVELDPESGENPVTARARSTVEIVRVSGVDPSILHRLPFTLSLSASSNMKAPGKEAETAIPDGESPVFFNTGALNFQNTGDLSLKSAGSFDEYGNQKIRIEMRKHIQAGNLLVADPVDRYLMEFSNPFASLLVGDRNWSLSPLLGSSDFGRGIGAAAKLPFVQVGGYYYSNVFAAEGGETAGGYALYERRLRDYRNGYAYQAAASAKTDLADTVHFSLAQTFQSPPKNIDASLDLAGMLDPEQNFHKAALFDGEAIFDLWHIAFKGVYADPGFKGLYTDLFQVNASVLYTLVDFMVDLRSFLSWSDNNLARDSSRSASHTLVAECTGAHEFTPFGTAVTAGYSNRTSGDAHSRMFYDTMTHTLLIRALQPLGDIKLGLLADFDLTGSALSDSFSFGHKTRATFLWNQSPGSTLNSTLFLNGSHFTADGSTWRFGGDAGVARAFRSDTFSFGLGNSWFIGSTNPWSTSISATGRFVHKFINQQDFSASLSALSTIEPEKIGHNFKVELRYSMPFSVPVSRKQSVALVRGRVVNGITGAPVAGLILRCDGLATTTNKQGIYSFYIAKDGDFYVTVDQTRLPPGTMTDIVTPYQVQLKRGKVKTLNFAVIPESVIEGYVNLYTREKGPEPEGTLKKGSGLENVLLELSNGETLKRVFTDKSGKFKFSHVQPGTWTVSLLDARIPKYHFIESTTGQFEIQPGQTERTEFKIIPEIRTVMIVEDELILTEEPPPPSRNPGSTTGTPPAGSTSTTPGTDSSSAEPPGAETSPVSTDARLSDS